MISVRISFFFPHYYLQIQTYFLQNFKNNEKCCPLLTSLVLGSPIRQNGRIVGAMTHVFIKSYMVLFL
ncbi:MAG: hypothetical protein E7418_02925 [Ruminococcaceae bacterium]|nr:hypothetical protein [Oscillospiraceae bacterium]